MKRLDLIRILTDEGCVLVRRNVITGMLSPVPRHRELNEYTARAIIRKLSAPKSRQ